MKSGSDSDSEEEILIFAEFEANTKIDNFRSVHVLGADTKNPVIQLDESFFTGKYELPVGTHMFFEPDDDAKTEDPLFDKLPEQNLKFLCKTTKYLNMQCAQITPKKGTSAFDEQTLVKDDLEVANFKSVQDAIEKFKSTWTPSQSAQLDLNKLGEAIGKN